MAQVKFNQISEISGKIGGSVYLRSKCGTSSRSVSSINTKISSSQSNQRCNISMLSRVWRGLSDIQRASWNDSTLLYVKKNKVGNSYYSSGFNLFIKCNANLLACNYTNLQLVAPSPLSFVFVKDALSLSIATRSGQLYVDFNLLTNFPVDESYYVLVSASSYFSQGAKRHRIKEKLLLVYYNVLGLKSNSFNITNEYINAFGRIPSVFEQATLKVSVIPKSNPLNRVDYFTTSIFSDAFAPTDIVNCTLWLDANDLVAGTNVSIWFDKSLDSNDAVQFNANYMPLVVANGIGGNQAVRFNGSKYLVINPFVKIQPVTIFLAWHLKTASNGQARYVFDGVNDVSKLSFEYALNTTRGTGLSIHGSLWNVVPNSSTPPFTKIHSLIYNTTASKIYENGILKFSGNVGTASLIGLIIGSYNGLLSLYFLDGDIAEMIVYDRLLSDSERIEVESYLFEKYPTIE